jgi:hypothetical protein
MNSLIKNPRQNPPSLFVVKRESDRRMVPQKKMTPPKTNSADKPVYPQIIMPEQPTAYLKAKRHDPL